MTMSPRQRQELGLKGTELADFAEGIGNPVDREVVKIIASMLRQLSHGPLAGIALKPGLKMITQGPPVPGMKLAWAQLEGER